MKNIINYQIHTSIKQVCIWFAIHRTAHPVPSDFIHSELDQLLAKAFTTGFEIHSISSLTYCFLISTSSFLVFCKENISLTFHQRLTIFPNATTKCTWHGNISISIIVFTNTRFTNIFQFTRVTFFEISI